MTVDAAVAAAIWTVAAFIMPARRFPMPPAPSLLFYDTWPGDCDRLHDRAQTGMRTAFGIIGTAAWLTSGILAVRPDAASISIVSLIATIAIVPATLPLSRRVAPSGVPWSVAVL